MIPLRVYCTAIAVLSCALAASGSVLDLSSYSVGEFRSELENHDSIFVKFFAPYCGHCKTMAKDFIQVAKKLQEEDPPVALAEVDCTSGTGTKICKKFNVKGYPQLELFMQGKPYKTYEGARTAKDFIEWLNTNAKLKSKRFSSYTELNQAVKNADEPVALAIFADKNDEMVERWHKAAKQVTAQWTFREVQFFHIFDDEASGSTAHLKSIGLTDGKVLKAPALILHRPPWLENKYEPTNIVFKQETKQDIAEWIFQKAFGVVLYRTRDNEETLKPPLIVAYYDFDFKKNPARTHKWRNRFVKAAQAHPDVKFAISNSQSFRKQLRRQSLEPPKDDEIPIVAGYDNYGTLYLMRDEFTIPNFEQFITDYKNGDVAPHLRSQEPPEDNDSRDVKMLVGGNFHKLVAHNPNDVFIAFYAPWCKHSKELEPTWEELAQQFRGEPGVEILKMDATANEVPSQFEVPLYPTIYFVPKDTKKPQKYEGGRYIHEFVQFLAKHATDELKGYKRDGYRRTSPTKTEL